MGSPRSAQKEARSTCGIHFFLVAYAKEKEQMPNINLTPDKAPRRKELFRIGVEALEELGWRVERIPGIGKSSVRRIVKGDESRVVAIRTTQDQWLAFPRNPANDGWVTLSEVDVVVAVSVDDREDPKIALVHIIEGDDMRDRFDRAYSARLAAGHSLYDGRGIWISLYDEDADEPVNRVGAGAGLANPPISRVRLQHEEKNETRRPEPSKAPKDDDKAPTTFEGIIAEAKSRLAHTLGISSSSIKITVEA